MTKTLIIVIMEELLAIVILTVIMMTYRWNSMEENKTTILRNSSGKRA